MNFRPTLKNTAKRPSHISSENILTHIITGSVWFVRETPVFAAFMRRYMQEKLMVFSRSFEKHKNTIVKNVLIKRGKRNRLFLHISAMTVLAIGIFVSPFISDADIFSHANALSTLAQEDSSSVLAPDDVFQTHASEKPRDKILTYTVQKGDTISLIAKKFGISEDTLRWENDVSGNSITVGDQLKILPVTGIAHKVVRDDTIYTIAKKYSANAQAIVDFPFNDFANPQTFSLVEGQIVIVPDGVKPEEQQAPRYAPKLPYIATGPINVTGAGFTWPIHGTMNQYFSWYHKAVDLGAATQGV